ncbi:sensor histidine kinase, partial [Acinetobacter sp. RIT592]
MKVSIKVKFSMFLAILLLLTVIILSTLVLRGIKHNQVKEYEIYLANQAKITNSYINQIDSENPIKNGEEFLKLNAQKLKYQLDLLNKIDSTIYDIYGKRLTKDTGFNKILNQKDMVSSALDDQIVYQVVDEYIYYMAPLYKDNNQIGVIGIDYNIKKGIDFYNNIQLLFIKIGTITFLLSFACSYFYFDRFSRSIIRLKKDTLHIKSGLYNKVTPLKRNDELGELSDGIYYMSTQIEENINRIKDEKEKLQLVLQKLREVEKQQKNFIGNITHEFKTPLTVIKTYMDLIDIYPDDINLINDAKVNIVKETQRLCEMVEKILHLSSLQKYNFEINCEEIDVKDILEEICSRMQGKVKKFNLELITNLQSGIMLGDKENLMHIFINLIDNA